MDWGISKIDSRKSKYRWGANDPDSRKSNSPSTIARDASSIARAGSRISLSGSRNGGDEFIANIHPTRIVLSRSRKSSDEFEKYECGSRKSKYRLGKSHSEPRIVFHELP